MARERRSSAAAPHPVARVQASLEGREPACIAINENSVLILGEHQFYPGYCVLWARDAVKELHQLSPLAYMGYLIELRQACEAVERAYQPWKLNLASLGNQVQHVHMHLFPRRADDAKRLEHPWVHAADFKAVEAEERDAAVQRLRAALSPKPEKGRP
jgi:diadenosine tetraphosphate (Ap4A) HIT family hydrolase